MDRKINIYNYEEFFIDYLDGNLSDNELIALEDFLLHHPQLREELEGMENAFLKPEETTFNEKENLKHIDLSLPVNHDNFDFFCIAETEGDLNEVQKSSFDEYLKNNPDRRKDYQDFINARLDKHEKVEFPGKKLLKKSVFLVYRREFITATAAAAGIALLLSVFTFFIDENPEIDNIASFEEEKVETAKSDTTSSQKSLEKTKDGKSDNDKSNSLSIPEKAKKAVKKAATNITIKTSIPIASVETSGPETTEIKSVELDRREIINRAKIDPAMLGNVSPLNTVRNDLIDIKTSYKINQQNTGPDPNEYLTLQEFAVQKLSDIIFREEKELNVINVASRGIEKINEVAGTNMKLEASAREGSNNKVLNFNSGLISFSTPINRED